MAEQLSLVMRDDFISDSTALDLLTWLADNGWLMAIGNGEDALDEALTIHVPGTSDDDLATNIQALDAMLVQVEHFENPVEPLGVWLRTQLSGETRARQALVTRAKRDRASITDPFIDNHYLRDYTLGLTRSGAWEATAALTYTASSINSLGGLADLGPVVGDIPARLALTTIAGVYLGGGPMNEFWIGLRSNRFGTAANFVPVWEAESGTLNAAKGAALTTANDSTASGSGTNLSVRVTFTDATFQLRWSMTVAQASPTHPGDQVGKMKVLGRFKVSSSATKCRVRLSSGFTGSSTFHSRDKVLVSGEDWALYELGFVTLPETGRSWAGAQVIDNQMLRLEMDRSAGAGTLDFDCLILVPVDEGFIYAYGGGVFYDFSDTHRLEIRYSADKRKQAVGYRYGYTGPYYNDIGVDVTGGLPVGAHTHVVFAAQRQGRASVFDDVADLSFQVYSRWLTLRGAE